MDRAALPVLEVNQDHQEPQDQEATQDNQVLPGKPDHLAPRVPLDHQDNLAQQVNRVHLDRLALKVNAERQDPLDQLDLQDNEVKMVDLVQTDNQDQ